MLEKPNPGPGNTPASSSPRWTEEGRRQLMAEVARIESQTPPDPDVPAPPKLRIKMPDIDAMEYVKCPQCGSEVTRLMESGVCYGCDWKAQEASATLRWRSEKLIEIVGGELPLKEFTFESYDVCAGNEKAYGLAKMFDRQTHNLYFYGSAGSGKTHLAYAIAIRAYMNGMERLQVLTSEQLSRKITGTNFERKEAVLKSLIAADILLLDDLCRKKETENTIDAICEIMDLRKYAPRGGLIISSNLSLDDMQSRLGDDRLPSRIIGMCKVVKVDPRNANGSVRDYRLNPKR